MRFQFSLFDPKLKRNLRSYFFQVSLATVALLVVLWLEDTMARAVIVAAIGSTAFVLFITPRNRMSSPRNVLGGHFLFALQAASSVGIAMFLMAATDTEHAPAAGTTLGVVAHDFGWRLVYFLSTSVVALVVMQRLLRSWLRDLN